MRYFFEIAYNGKQYSGWQSQHNATGIQSVIEDALTKLLREKISIVASGRTDAGVHCEQQFFHADVNSIIEVDKLKQNLNSFLPKDISIESIRSVTEKANARFDALQRTYKYRISTKKNPFTVEQSWHFFKPLDMALLNEASALLIGIQDFQCFSKVHTDVNHFICEISSAAWYARPGMLEFTITANRFLRGMVRAIVGTLVDVGTRKVSVDKFKSILQSKDRTKAGANVPPEGLFLVAVIYPDSIFK